MKVLVIDDALERHEGFEKEFEGQDIEGVELHKAMTYDEAIAKLSERTYDLICFDHDLNDFDAEGNERTGACIARFMAEQGMKCSEARVHSNNTHGAINIVSILRSGNVVDNPDKAYYDPFRVHISWDMIGLKEEFEKGSE